MTPRFSGYFLRRLGHLLFDLLDYFFVLVTRLIVKPNKVIHSECSETSFQALNGLISKLFFLKLLFFLRNYGIDFNNFFGLL